MQSLDNHHGIYGEMRYSTGSLYTDRLFTGQQQLAGLGQEIVD